MSKHDVSSVTNLDINSHFNQTGQLFHGLCMLLSRIRFQCLLVNSYIIIIWGKTNTPIQFQFLSCSGQPLQDEALENTQYRNKVKEEVAVYHLAHQLIMYTKNCFRKGTNFKQLTYEIFFLLFPFCIYLSQFKSAIYDLMVRYRSSILVDGYY